MRIKVLIQKNYELFRSSNLEKVLIELILTSEFQERDSGWTLLRILNLTVNKSIRCMGPNFHEKLKEESDNQPAIFKQRMFRMIGDSCSTPD